ncbi:MAG: ABC transporter ATP-binding protein [Anaerolineales bacterium]|nr:MAG: ABC transporter ATP-binding protein [Anaerolineales bacterium]
MTMIEINHLTKDYGDGRGIFGIDLSVDKGEVFGFVGINGAGKTTTIRHLMGFLKPENGYCKINGLDCWSDASEVMRMVGYIPGEIAFPDASTGNEFLKKQAELLNITDMSFTERIIKKLQLDPTANLKRMSKGMKQKTAVVAALMADHEVLIFDEPTTGFDPLMRLVFVEILLEEKKKGKTIFMSSHMFDEVEDTCDKVALIKDGKIVDIKATKEIKHSSRKSYTIEFNHHEDFIRFLKENFNFESSKESQSNVTINIEDEKINELTKRLVGYDIKYFKENKYTLDKYFRSIY